MSKTIGSVSDWLKNNANVGSAARQVLIEYVLPSLLIFALSVALRRFFFAGFVLCDDAEEFALVRQLATFGLSYTGHLEYRFGMWMFNVLAFKLLGISEASFFLPSWMLSAGLAVIAYFLFLHWQYRRSLALVASLFVASAPFEIIIGAVRANDLFLAFFLALGMLFFFLLEKRPGWQAIGLAVAWWLAFNTKLWMIYFLPALGVYYLIQGLRHKVWSGAFAFSACTLILHGLTALFWKWKWGVFLPFLDKISATYPVAAKDLGSLFLQYPRHIFVGSEFGTTLFGYIPWLLVILLLVKCACSIGKKGIPDSLRLDRIDGYLFVYYGSFFLFLNFFPNNYQFDQYYSVPRIFRYLAPLSFPLTVHLVKLLVDIVRAWAVLARSPAALASVLGLLACVNVYQTAQAMRPGTIYRGALMSAVQDIRLQSPRRVIADSWITGFLRDIYLRDMSGRTQVIFPNNTYAAKDYEAWLRARDAEFGEDTLLLTGIGSCVFYGAQYDGLRLAQFRHPLGSQWAPVKQYATLDYLNFPEPVRLWRHRARSEAPAQVTRFPSANELLSAQPDVSGEDAELLFRAGISLFDRGQYADARPYFAKAARLDPAQADNAFYFFAINYYRQAYWRETIVLFRSLIDEYPNSRWVSGAHYHIGLSYKELQNIALARQAFRVVVEEYRHDAAVFPLAQAQLELLADPRDNWLHGLLQRYF